LKKFRLAPLLEIPQIDVGKEMGKRIPGTLKDYILPFNWDVKTVWSLEAPTRKVNRSSLDYLLHLPLWSSIPGKGMQFDISPLEVIQDPTRSPHQAKRIENTDTIYPIDMIELEGKLWILDGIHRLAKLYVLGVDYICVRIHHASVIEKITDANQSVHTTPASAPR